MLPNAKLRRTSDGRGNLNECPDNAPLLRSDPLFCRDHAVNFANVSVVFAVDGLVSHVSTDLRVPHSAFTDRLKTVGYHTPRDLCGNLLRSNLHNTRHDRLPHTRVTLNSLIKHGFHLNCARKRRGQHRINVAVPRRTDGLVAHFAHNDLLAAPHAHLPLAKLPRHQRWRGIVHRPHNGGSDPLLHANR